MSQLSDVLRDAIPVVLGVFFVYLAFAIPRWIALAIEHLLDRLTRFSRRR